MFVRGKIGATVAALMILLAACGSSGVANNMSSPAEQPFRRTATDWRPFSPAFITFRHVEDDATAGTSTKTYVDWAEARTFSKMFGNFLFDDRDPAVAGLVGYPSPLSMLNVTSTLVRLNSPEAMERELREQVVVLGSLSERGAVQAEVLLFPRADQFDHYLGVLNANRSGPFTAVKQLAPGCVVTRTEKFADSRALAVLAMQVPDDAVSWADPHDRACLMLFFADSFGVKSDAMSNLLPATGPGQDCVLARILRPNSRTSDYHYLRYESSCPEAPVKRASSLVWYAEQHGAGLDAEASANLATRVRAGCRSLRDQNLFKDQSCPIVLQGAQ
jgi:hypothetical protein